MFPSLDQGQWLNTQPDSVFIALTFQVFREFTYLFLLKGSILLVGSPSRATVCQGPQFLCCQECWKTNTYCSCRGHERGAWKHGVSLSFKVIVLDFPDIFLAWLWSGAMCPSSTAPWSCWPSSASCPSSSSLSASWLSVSPSSLAPMSRFFSGSHSSSLGDAWCPLHWTHG